MTPPDLLARLVGLFPAFAAKRADPGNCFIKPVAGTPPGRA